MAPANAFQFSCECFVHFFFPIWTRNRFQIAFITLLKRSYKVLNLICGNLPKPRGGGEGSGSGVRGSFSADETCRCLMFWRRLGGHLTPGGAGEGVWMEGWLGHSREESWEEYSDSMRDIRSLQKWVHGLGVRHVGSGPFAAWCANARAVNLIRCKRGRPADEAGRLMISKKKGIKGGEAERSLHDMLLGCETII